MWSRDGISVEEGEKALEGLEEGPVGEQADALVVINISAAVRSKMTAWQAKL